MSDRAIDDTKQNTLLKYFNQIDYGKQFIHTLSFMSNNEPIPKDNFSETGENSSFLLLLLVKFPSQE